MLERLLTELVPALRQHACAFSGSALIGDELVTRTIETAAKHADELRLYSTEIMLFKYLISACTNMISACTNMMPALPIPENAALCDTSPCARKLARLPPRQRHAFLLQSCNRFSFSEMQCILDMNARELWLCLNNAFDEVTAATSTNVLIIEDNLMMAEQLGYIARELGHRIVEVAQSRQQAIEKSNQRRYGLVLAEIDLSDGDNGYDAVTDLLQHQHPFVIYVTGNTEIVQNRLQMDEQPVIFKPVDHRQLKNLITTSLFFHDPNAA